MAKRKLTDAELKQIAMDKKDPLYCFSCDEGIGFTGLGISNYKEIFKKEHKGHKGYYLI